MTEFRSRGVRSLVELHNMEMRNFLTTWKRFKASGKPMPEARGDAFTYAWMAVPELPGPFSIATSGPSGILT